MYHGGVIVYRRETHTRGWEQEVYGNSVSLCFLVQFFCESEIILKKEINFLKSKSRLFWFKHGSIIKIKVLA